MAKKSPNLILKHFHRNLIGRAKRYIRLNFQNELTLKTIAKNAGASEFHFARMFMSYTGETPFTFINRIRLLNALKMLQEDEDCSITEIALSIGLESQTSFNKSFKKILKISPRDFRNLGKVKQDELIYSLSITPNEKEIKMNLNLTTKPEIITRNDDHILYVERNGEFAEVAMPAWYDLIPNIDKNVDKNTIREYLGFSMIDGKAQDETQMHYYAAVSFGEKPKAIPKGLAYKKMPGGKFAKFILTGPWTGVWPAFDKMFQILAEKKIELREGACIENYLSNPEVVPEAELLTELLIPIK